ncbi:hypothetical protein R50073_07130 [Maricurvus nonylphenolicus]
MSQEELALELDSSTRHISRLETARVHPSREVVLKIANFFGLKKRDTANLLIAAGYIPENLGAEFRDQKYRWLRKTLAMNLDALDPFPAMLTDGTNGILMFNKSWLGLFHDKLDISGDIFVSEYFEAIMGGIVGRENEAERETLMTGLSLTLKQEALIKNDAILDDWVDRMAEKYQFPENWPEKAAAFEPQMSFPIYFEVEGKLQQFYHMCNSVTSLGPVENGMEPLLLMNKMFPRDHKTDLSSLVDHTLDHPCLCRHEIEGDT